MHGVQRADVGHRLERLSSQSPSQLGHGPHDVVVAHHITTKASLRRAGSSGCSQSVYGRTTASAAKCQLPGGPRPHPRQELGPVDEETVSLLKPGAP